MIVTNEDISYNYLEKLLDNSLSLSLNENVNNYCSLIPVIKENNYNIIRYSDLKSMQESYCIDFQSAIDLVLENNGIEEDNFIVNIDESSVLENPELISEELRDIPYSISPIPDTNASLACDYLIDSALEYMDESYLDILEESDYETLNEIFDGLTPEEKSSVRTFFKRNRDRYNGDREGYKKDPFRRPAINAAFHRSNMRTGKNRLYGSQVKADDRNPNQIGMDKRWEKEINPQNQPRLGYATKPKPIYLGYTPSSKKEALPAPSAKKPIALPYHPQPKPDIKPKKPIIKPNNPKNKNNTSKGINKFKLGAGAGLVGGALLLKNRKSILAKLHSLRNKQLEVENKMQSASPEKRGFFRKILDKIKSIISRLTSRLNG